MATCAQLERRLISQRTKDALAAKRAQGVRLGRPPSTSLTLERGVRRLRAGGHSLQAIADQFNREGATPRGGLEWRPSTLHRIMRRAETTASV
jgi:DNA invertase Pin-like site-specific DNA recombinase